jgi:RHS repeat-associated protein
MAPEFGSGGRAQTRRSKDVVSCPLRSDKPKRLAERIVGHLSRRLNILAVLLLAIFAALVPVGAGAQEPPAPSSTSVWYAAGASLVRVDAESGQAAGSVTLSSQTSPVSSLASHPTDGSVAMLAKGRLLGFDGSGSKTFEEPVAAASSLGTAPVLASDPHDGRLWVGGSGVIVLADASGQNQRTLKLNTGEVVKAISAFQDGGAYALTQSRLLRLSKAGELISQRPMSTGGVKSPSYLAVDEYGGLGYVANTTDVAQVALAKVADPPIRKIRPKGGVGALSMNPFDGTLHVASRPSGKTGTANLYAYDDGTGLLLKKVGFQARAVRALSFDTPSQTLWVGTDANVLGFQRDLSPKAQLGAAGLNTLAAAPLSLSSRLSLLEPHNGDITNDPQQVVRLHLKAYCNNETCPEGFGYGSKLALNASLNGQDVSNLFKVKGDLGAPTGAEAVYAPTTGLPEGENRLVAETVDHFGVRSNRLEAAFNVDTTAPRFLEIKPEDGSVLSEEPATITGRVDDPKARVYLEGLTELGGRVISDGPNGFSFEVPLKEGENSFRLLAYDEVDNVGEKTLKYFYEAPLSLTITEPAQGSTVTTQTVTVKGTVDGPSGTTVRVGEVEASVDSQGNFVAENVPLAVGPNTLVVEATAPGGKSVQATLELLYEPANPDDPPDTEPPVDGSDPTVHSERPPDSPLPAPGPLPPDPSEVAPPVEQGVPTDMADSTEFLYEGANPVQTGVEPDTIEDKRVAVLKGRVLNSLGEPVPGVRITVLDHPEYGETLTREDGQFDIAVNGGSTVTLVYEKDRYMPAQRQVEAPWRDFATLEDAVLVGFSKRVTDLDLAGSDEMQVAQGSTVTDADGSRQATVLLPGDTQAEMVMPDGTKEPLPQMDFRATEYTVGEDGPEAMPAPLPPSSGYTYAVELSVDEAVEVGAEEVRFTKPLYTYVDNFLGFSVGEHVPSGYYDKEKGQWVPAQDGRVIKILSITNGLADLDVDGSGAAASGEALTQLGITDEERQKLANLYAAGQSLWRVPVEHFTAWDFNWPYGPPDDAESPPGDGSGGDTDDSDCQGGSIIECQNQTLREHVGLSGAPFDLYYGSDGVKGRKASRTVNIKVSGERVPSKAIGISLKIWVAGQLIEHRLAAAPNQTRSFTWDGKDAYGRPIVGERDLTYLACYVYKPVLYDAASSFNQSFGNPGVRGAHIEGWNRSTVNVCRSGSVKVSSWDDRGQGLGGWTPDILHQYDPAGKSLQLGSGDWRTAESIPNVITTAAGTGVRGAAGDGGPATEAQIGWVRGMDVAADGSVYLSDTTNGRIRRITPDGKINTVIQAAGGPYGIAVAPDDTIYFVERGNQRVRRLDPDGIVTTVAGTGAQGFSGDGGPATEAKLNDPWGLALAPDGSLYIADTFNNRVRKVSTDGIITTVAGRGWTSGPIGDGGPATQALIHPFGIAVGPDGALYIADNDLSRIRRVGPDGIISTIAGGGATLGDGGPATQASVSGPLDVDVEPDGAIYIAESSGGRIRYVNPEGIITTVAGTGGPGSTGDGGPATQAQITQPFTVAVAPDGSVYIDNHTHRLRKVTTPLPGAGIGDKVIASEDGSELYVFNDKGKHLRTVDAATGTIRYRFSYDEQGRLSAVEDVDGLVTSVERDAKGDATAIVAPNGDRTELTLDEGGYLASVANPAGETVRLTYDANGGGLLQSLTDPKNNTTRFSYDGLGRLTKDEDPAGGFKELSRTDQGKGDFTTSLTTALGRKNTYEVDNLPDGSSRRTNTDPSGLKIEGLIGADGTRKVTAADGTTVSTVEGPDPRFGMQAPITKSATVTTPGGLTYLMTNDSRIALTNTNNPSSIRTITDTTTVNGNSWTSTYDAATKTTTTKSPEGRQGTFVEDEKDRVLLEETQGSAPTGYLYDERGRLTKVTFGTGVEARTYTYAYDEKDRLKSEKDPLGRETSFEYDAAGRLTKQTLPDGRFISFSYDANGNLTAVTPPQQPKHEFGYTNRDQNESYSAPKVGTEENTTTYEYNLDKQPVSATLPGGEKLEFIYDAGGRLQTLRYPGDEKSFSYDPRTGNPTTVSNGSGTISYGFDGYLPVSETSSGQVPSRVELRYNANMRVAGISVNGAPEVPFAYDKDALLIRAGSLEVSRDAGLGLVTGTTLSNTTDTRTYNAFGEIESYRALSGATEQFGTAHKYDSLGRLTEKTETVEGDSTTYTYSYNGADRLEEVRQDGNLVASYTYDENGNRLSRVTPNGATEGEYDAQDHLTSYGTNEYAYRPDGQLRSKIDSVTGESTSYAYDALGNLLSVTLPDSKKVEYVVDAQNRRVGKKVDGQLVQGFVYHGKLNPVAELDGSGNIVSRFIYATKPNVPDYMVKGDKTYRIVSDHLGSVRLVVDASTGEVAQRIDYDEFGNVLNDTSPGFQPFGFAGGLYDQDTKLTRFGARDYDAETGRWTAKDPMSFAAGDTNLYGYVGNQPTGFVDPSGYAPSFKNWFDKCSRLEERIQNIREQLIDRAKEWKENKGPPGGGGPLPEACPATGSLKPYYSTHGGHAVIIGELETALQKAEDLYRDYCGGPPPPPLPQDQSNPNQSHSPMDSDDVVAASGTAATIVKWILIGGVIISAPIWVPLAAM